jgi:class 3 adenylate cyclase/CHASE2 domain-containing sensor protein
VPLLLGVAATAAVLGAHLGGLDQATELRWLDWRMRNMPNMAPAERVAHVCIDDLSIERLGRWPWPREVLAGIVDALADAGASSIVLDIILPDAQELRYESPVERIYSGAPMESQGAVPPRRVFDDALLADAIDRDNVILALHAAPRGPITDAARLRALEHVNKAALAVEGLGPAGALEVVPPALRLAQQARHTGFVNAQTDADGVLRRTALLAGNAGDARAQPHLMLAAAMQELSRRHGGVSLSLKPQGLALACDDGFGGLIPLDEQGLMRINWARPSGGASPRNISAAQVAGVWQARKAIATLADNRRLRQIHAAQRLGHKELLDLFAQADEAYQRRVLAQVRCERAKVGLSDGENLELLQQAQSLLAGQELEIEQEIDRQVRELGDEFFAQNATEQERAELRALRQAMADIDAQAQELAENRDRTLQELGTMVQGRACLVGSFTTAAADFVVTPPAAVMAGVEAHSNILATILSGAFVRGPWRWADAAAIAVCGLAAALLAWRFSAPAAVMLVLGAAAAYAAANAFVLWRGMSVWVALVAPLSAMGASLLVVTAWRQLTEERAKRHIRSMFAQALSGELVDRLIANPAMAELGGQRREITCFFSDLEGFTPLSKALGERRTVRVLNEYFDSMAQVIQARHGGYLNKFLGDGILALFGAPAELPDHAGRSLLAAIECHKALDELNRQWGLSARLRMRVGLATGSVMVGNCGSSSRMDYTAIGDTVNLASRLEGACKFFGASVIVAESTWRKAQAALAGVVARPLGQVVVVGRDEPVAVWEALAPDAPQAAGARTFAAGVDAYAAGRFDEATAHFEEALELCPDDAPAKAYIALARQGAAWPGQAGWSGVIRLTEK